jgi:molecular chaperone GrpE
MGEIKEPPADLDATVSEEIEIEFVDEDTGADAEGEALDEPCAETGLEPVALDASVEAEIERLESEIEELRDIHLRKLAEFDNFRKRTERERVEIRRHANEEFVREILPVLDNFERALEHGPNSDSGAFREGVEMIAKQFWDTLERLGIKKVDPMGERFSPEFHEAVHRVEDESMEAGTVASVLAKGYVYNGRLIRPAMVGVVAESSSAEEVPAEPGASENGAADE